MKLSSPAFKHNELIPAKYTCDGDNVNPPLLFEKVPSEAKSFALIVDDPDAPRGTWVHWVLWNIDPKTVEIKENTVPAGSQQGVNDFKTQSYGGPCPPSGTHRYFFKTTDNTLNLTEDHEAYLENAMRVIAQAELIGFTRK
jgi:Raf kinase inhibitor-like YbhB/YbcL family protein